MLASTASGATFYWTNAGAMSALKATPIWKGSAGPNGSFATMRATSATVRPYGRTHRVKGKQVAAMWDVTATVSFDGTASQERFCLRALGPLAGPRTMFQIGGWAYLSPTGGCAHWAASGQGTFDWGGSKTVLSHP